MGFNADLIKPAQKVILSRKLKTVLHPSITFNNNPLSLCYAQKHWGLVLDSKLTFNEHIKHILSKVNKPIGLLHKFRPVLQRSSLLTIYKTFIRSHFDYADVVYDQSYKSSFHEKLELIQYNTALEVTGAIRGSSSEKCYQELGLASLQSRPSPNSIFYTYNEIILLTRLLLGLSHFIEHKFKHGFNDAINPICVCGGDSESINSFFLHCPEYCETRQTLFDNIQTIDKMLLSQNESSLTHLFLYGDPKRNSNVNAFILNSAIEFILSSGRFNAPLFNGA